jgi:RecB family exonuclease
MTFDPVLHEYRDGDTVVPSVTQVLKQAGYIDDRWFSQEAADRGSAVHELCDRYARGMRYDRDGTNLLVSYPYLSSFAKWLRDTGAYVVKTETAIDATLAGMRFAGRYDILADIDGKLTVVDIKTSSGAARWHQMQVAAYAYASKATHAAVLYLKPHMAYRERRLNAAEVLTGIADFTEAMVKVQGVPA